MEANDHQPCPSPSPYRSSSSSLFRDISNFKTPKRTIHAAPYTPNHHSFAAVKQTPRTPCSSFRRHRPSPSRSAAARRLRAVELEQCQSARKAQNKKDLSLRSLSKSLSVWLNFLFESPGSCGCDPPAGGDRIGVNGKREGGPGVGVRVDGVWRSPKRQRDVTWSAAGGGGGGEEMARGFPSSRFSSLRASLSDVCSFDDLTLRLRGYLSLDGCKEVFDAMTHVVKSIDDGRLKMKVHCPIVTDFGMKEKAVRILMCYNPIWLRIGLYIVFGGDSLLLSNEGASSDQEAAFLKLVIEKQFFSHAGLAKEYAYNKMVEGLYRPGYYEALGNIILKRFLLLAIILDRAKSYSSLPLTYGIDGIDGGSPLLFTMETKIKSSRQAIHDFLSSDVMHGEGNLLAHLLSLGYKVSYQQCALVEYDFRVRDVFLDLQDGVRISRAIYLLQHDSSILMKLVVPSDTRKKNLANCDVALQYIRKAGVPLQDEDGMDIVGEDVANGDKELVLSLLWNVFVHLQLPLLVNRTILDEEISKIRRIDMEHVNNIDSSPLAMLLNWIQAICETYDFHIEKISALVDGKAIWCLLDYYFRKELHCSCSSKDSNETKGEESIMSATDYTDAVHNFILSQKLTALLGNFPEVLQISDILENNGASNDKSVVILLVFLASQLVMKKNMDKLNFHKLLGRNCQNSEKKHAILTREDSDGNSTEEAARKFKVIQAWWQDMAESNKCVTTKPTSSLSLSSTNKQSMEIHKENAVILIQSHVRRMGEEKRFSKMMKTVSFMQTIFRAWLAFRLKSKTHAYSIISSEESPSEKLEVSETVRRYVLFFVDRHGFVKLKKSALLIQQAAKNWIDHKHQKCLGQGRALPCVYRMTQTEKAASSIQIAWKNYTVRKSVCDQTEMSDHKQNWIDHKHQKCLGQGRALPCVYRMTQTEKAASSIQIAWKNYTVRKSVCEQNFAATKIQSEIRCRQLRREYIRQKEAIIKIQRNLRSLRCQKAFEEYKIATRSAVIVQSHVRGWIARQSARKRKYHIVVIQRHCRGWLTRRNFLSKRESVITIQSVVRSLNCWKSFYCQRNAAIEIQRFIRGHITRKRLLGASCHCATFPIKCPSEDSSACFQSAELQIVTHSVLKLQRWWKVVLLHRLRARSAVIIQSHLRVWIARRKVARERHHIVAIQSHWKGYLVRKDSREHLIELRLRMEKTARSVDDKMRIINKLLAALAELQSMRSISDVIHTCATLDKATEVSQRCCEELVAAGAISTLLEIIATISRSIPDQEVLKHALSTLRNLARYPHLLEELINARGSVQTILLKLLRNKEEGYFIASQLLKKICSKPEGIQAMRRSPGLLRRLHSLVEELSRKASNEKRNSVRLITEKRYKEAVDIFKMVTENR